VAEERALRDGCALRGGRALRVLIVGGTGVFGSRLARLLAGDARLAVTVAGRDGVRVETLAREVGVAGLALDWPRDLDGVLVRGDFDAVVHAAGPFQGQDYTVAETCVRQGVHYIDLADDRAFVCGIDRLDAAARAAGVLVCSGVSTVPALTGAVVAEALKQGAAVECVAFGVMPGNDAPRGPALVAAILGGAGKPIPDQPGYRVWSGLRRMRVPGIGVRWVAACDVPDPSLFRTAFGVRDTYAGGGLELSVLHLGLWLLALPVRLRLVQSLSGAAAPLAWMANRLRRFGTDRGGLRVDLDGGGKRRSWFLLAEGGDGPYVPAIPAAALLRKLAAGGIERRGATACIGLLSLADCEAEWRRAHLRIASAWDDGIPLSPALYQRALGKEYERLPAICQRLHDGAATWQGECEVDGADNAIGKILSWLFQFPAAGNGPIRVELVAREAREIWTRHVGGRAMRSQQSIGVRRPPGWIVERFGPWAFDLELRLAGERLELVMQGGRLLGLPLPRAILPRIEASESGAGGIYRFDVTIGLPLIGRLVRYRGTLTDR
jgi:hypothetical protein